MSEKRRVARTKFDAEVQISWSQDQGFYQARGRCLDISETGLKAEFPRPVPARTLVHFRVTGYRELHGTATVRHAEARGARFLVGVEFNGGLRFRPAADCVRAVK